MYGALCRAPNQGTMPWMMPWSTFINAGAGCHMAIWCHGQAFDNKVTCRFAQCSRSVLSTFLKVWISPGRSRIQVIPSINMIPTGIEQLICRNQVLYHCLVSEPPRKSLDSERPPFSTTLSGPNAKTHQIACASPTSKRPGSCL